MSNATFGATAPFESATVPAPPAKATWVNVSFFALVWFFLKVAVAILPALVIVLLYMSVIMSMVTMTATVTAK